MFSVAIAGASGYAGGELVRLLASHPMVSVDTVTGHSTAGQYLGQVHRHLSGPLSRLPIRPTDPTLLNGHDVVFLALPHGHSARLCEQLESLGTSSVLIDCAADHRLEDPGEWERYYSGTAPPPWAYGMPELLGTCEKQAIKQRDILRHSKRIAVPGCNATAVTLALQPAIGAQLIDDERISATLAVGYSGAGKALRENLMAAEALGSMVPYSVGGTHRHIPEIIQNFRHAGADNPSLVFTPVLVPTSRGILATVVAPLRQPCEQADVDNAYMTYASEPFIDYLGDTDLPVTGALTGTGRVMVSAHVDERAKMLVTLCALDNLGKGTATAAIQSMNLALGIDESIAIPTIGVAP